ncbi:MAG: M23 family metallopeptidase [Clostridia bacterium]|nr:M23 family metallopeptidase [Clostridia bacterium]
MSVKEKVTDFLNKQGFYVVLGLSLMVVFVTVMLSMNSNKRAKQQTVQSFYEVEPAEQNGQPVMENMTEEKPTEETKKKEQALSLSRPVAGDIIMEYAADKLLYNSTLKQWTTHSGIDIGADEGTAVKAAKGGTVESVKNDALMGTIIVLSHDGGVNTVYANLADEVSLSAGDKVSAGTEIGKIGKTAISEFDMDPHLHFEVIINGEHKNPAEYLK